MPESLLSTSAFLCSRGRRRVRTVIGVGNQGPPPLTLSRGTTSPGGNRGCLLPVGANLGSPTSTATLTLPALALSLPVGFSHVFLHVLGLAGSLVPRPGNNGNGGSGVNSGRCSLWARTLDSVSSCTFLVEGLLSFPSFSGLPFGELPLDDLVSNTLTEGVSVLGAGFPNILLGKLLSHVRRGGGFRPPLVHEFVLPILHSTNLP
jgi:hypothetical protein